MKMIQRSLRSAVVARRHFIAQESVRSPTGKCTSTPARQEKNKFLLAPCLFTYKWDMFNILIMRITVQLSNEGLSLRL